MPQTNVFSDKRADPRVSIKIPVKYRLEESVRVVKTAEEWKNTNKNTYTLDMSLSGMRITVDQPLTVGDILLFDIYLLEKKNVINPFAKVKWVKKNDVGIHFMMIKDEDKESLKEFLEKNSSGNIE